MSFHFAVFITSERCGHCRNMRGDGILLSKQKIQREKKQANIPGGNHYDATFMKKIITGETEVAKVRVLNVHYKGFNPNEGVMDISVFTLEADNKTVRQTMIKEKNGKTLMEIYNIGDTGKKLNTQEIETKWEDTIKTYIPTNLSSYAYFYPTLTLFHYDAWMNSIRTGEPVYGYVNGLGTKEESPYGAMPSQNPNPIDFAKFLASFFGGGKKIEAKPQNSSPTGLEASKPKTESQETPTLNLAPKTKESKTKESKTLIAAPEMMTCGGNKKFKLYVKE